MSASPTRPSVSVVITTYDHARFLDHAIASVRTQTVPVEEIIVVDDGSSDDPASIVRRHPGVSLIRQDNQGLAAARNTGLRAARGEYVAFLDADDRLRPPMVAVNLRQMQDHPERALVYGAYDYIDEAGEHMKSVPLQPPGEDAYATFLSGNCIGMHGTVLYRRAALQAEGGFDPSLRTCEDYDLYLRLSRRHRVAASKERLAEYRRHGSNMSNDIPHMLSTALAVLGRHRDAARSRPDWLAAYERGVEGWKSYYGPLQWQQFGKALRTRSGVLSHAARALRVAAMAPQVVLREACFSFSRRTRVHALRQRIRFGNLHRTTPISCSFGFDRGKPVDRRYVEAFLAAHSRDVRGRVLEVGDNAYTMQFGGDQVIASEVLNRYAGAPATTYVGDLSAGDFLPSETFDCIVLTQTLHLIFDMPAAVATLHRILKPGGVLLLTVPWASPIDRWEWGDDWYWSVSPKALVRLLEGPFARGEVEVTAYGNVMSATGFMYGLAEHELSPEDLDVHDPFCPVIVAGRAAKAGGGA